MPAAAADAAVERVSPSLAGKAFRRSQRRAGVLIVCGFVLAVVLLPLFFYSFWVLLEALLRVGNLPRGTSLLGRLFAGGFADLSGWPFDVAFLLSTLAAWGILYLCYDRFALAGSAALAAETRRNAERRLGAPLPAGSLFVEARPESDEDRVGAHWVHDAGWLIVAGDGLRFLGDTIVGSVPRSQIRDVTLEGGRFGLAPCWVCVALADPSGRDDLHFLVRGGAARLSDTRRGAEKLMAALRDASVPGSKTEFSPKK